MRLLAASSRDQRYRDAARRSARRALELQPDLPEAHLAMGDYYFGVAHEPDSAMRELEIARSGMPNDPDVAHTIGGLHRRRGNWSDAIRWMERAAELDPRDYASQMTLGTTYMFVAEYDKAMALYSRLATIFPEQPEPLLRRASQGNAHGQSRFAERCDRAAAAGNARS